jgi:hypothetical protein
MSLNSFSWVPYHSKYLQDFSGEFSELRAIFRGLNTNSGLFWNYFIYEIN